MKTNKKILTLILVLFSVMVSACSEKKPYQTTINFQDSTVSADLPWSIRLGNSFVLRHPGAKTYNAEFPSNKWTYEQGVMLEAMRQLWLKTNDSTYWYFIRDNINQYVNDAGIINTYQMTEYNLDKINTGRALLFLYQETGNSKYKIAADTLRKQIQNQPRTVNGGFWHKQIYPFQMWLDGLYMAEPFYAMYSKMFEGGKNYDDVIHQFVTVYEKTLDEKTGLLYHAWNENKEQKWADENGKAPNIWGRAMGWYMMAMVDVLDILPEDYTPRTQIIAILQKLSEALVNAKDKETGLWFQITNLPEKEGNYLESSSASMFTYAFAKGANLGYLDKKYLSIAQESFDAIIKHHVTVDERGFVSLHNTCAGAGLGGDPYRDGSFEYYISVPQRTNDFKGFGPLIFAAIELEKSNKD